MNYALKSNFTLKYKLKKKEVMI